MVKCLPTMWEIWVQSLYQEDPLEKGMASHSSTLAWKIPGTEEPGRLHSPWGHKQSDTAEASEHTCTLIDLKIGISQLRKCTSTKWKRIA